MFQRQTDHSLDTLISMLDVAGDCGTKPPHSLPVKLGMVVNEIGVIFISTEDDDERARAEGELTKLLGREERVARFAACGYLTERLIRGQPLSDNASGRLIAFKEDPANAEIVEMLAERMT